jgi:uncharacterized membrane protein YeaQ/YmgE (transglycosylase-associated protein family)
MAGTNTGKLTAHPILKHTLAEVGAEGVDEQAEQDQDAGGRGGGEAGQRTRAIDRRRGRCHDGGSPSRSDSIGKGDTVLGLIISAIVVGLIIGALGRLVVPGRQNMSIWLTIGIGVAAALVGSFIASALGVGETRGIDWIELIIQVALAAGGVALVAGRSRPGSRRL